MARYIQDQMVIDAFYTQEGLDHVKRFITDKSGEEPEIVINDDDSLYFKGHLKEKFYTTIIGVHYDIYINPCSDKDGNNYIGELYDVVMELPSVIRNSKIETLLK